VQPTFAWFHPPKTGSSFGTVLAHVANSSLPPCARISSCTTDPSAPSGRSASLHEPYTPHRCFRATDRFMTRFPPSSWFHSVRFWPDPDDGWGSHDPIASRTFTSLQGSFYGLFRPPLRLIASAYVRMLDETLASLASARRAPTKLVSCLRFLGVSGNMTSPRHLLEALRSTPTTPMGKDALMAFARSRQGFVTRMLAGKMSVGHARDAGCPGRELSQPPEALVSLAISRLDGFRFVGLTDEWARSVCLFHRMHGDRRCRPGEMVNSRPSGPRTAHLHEETLRALGFRDPADEAVFAAARGRFERSLERWGIDDNVCTTMGCTQGAAAACATGARGIGMV
jgi:hypothetical protein